MTVIFLGDNRVSRAGLTVIELLVVIGILGVLIALLYPALRGARESSKQVKCLQQLRQITAALVMYSDDNDGYGPATKLDGIVQANEIADGVPDIPVFLSKYQIRDVTFRCPDDKIAYFQTGYGSSYIYSGSLSGRLFDTWFLGKPVNPATFQLVGEGMGLHRKANNMAYLDGHAALQRD